MKKCYVACCILICCLLAGCTSGPSNEEVLKAIKPILQQEEQAANMLMFGQGKLEFKKVDVESTEKMDDAIYKVTLILESIVKGPSASAKKMTTKSVYKFKKVDAEWQVIKNLSSETISEEEYVDKKQQELAKKVAGEYSWAGKGAEAGIYITLSLSSDGTAYYSSGSQSIDGAFEVGDEKVIFHGKMQNKVFIINDDGSLRASHRKDLVLKKVEPEPDNTENTSPNTGSKLSKVDKELKNNMEDAKSQVIMYFSKRLLENIGDSKKSFEEAVMACNKLNIENVTVQCKPAKKGKISIKLTKSSGESLTEDVEIE